MTLSRVPAAREHRRHRRHRHPQADAPAARRKGAQNGCIVALAAGAAVTPARSRRRVAQARAAPSMAGPRPGQGRVACSEPYEWTRDRVDARQRLRHAGRRRSFHVVAFDYGVKNNILRMLAERGCKVTVVPAQTPAAEVLALQARRRLPRPTAPATRSPATTRSRRRAS